MTKPIVLCDVDGVVADFVGRVLEVLFHEFGKSFTPADVDQWFIKDALELSDEEWRVVSAVISQPGFAAGLAPLPGAVEGVKALAEISDLYFVTSPWLSSMTWTAERTRWLEKRFGQKQGRKIVPTEHKHLVHGDLLIDDKPEYLQSWASAQMDRGRPQWLHGDQRRERTGWRWALWDAPHNQLALGYDRVCSWPQVIKLVRETWL